MIIKTSEIKPGIAVLEMSGRVQMGNDCKRIEKEVEDHLQRNEKFMILISPQSITSTAPSSAKS